jgi:hypothetical protein
MEYLRLEPIVNNQFNFKIINFYFYSKIIFNLPLIYHFHYPMLVKFIYNQTYLIGNDHYFFNLNFFQ